jgi:pullulanase/glycogen debranching enzyme
MHSFVRRLIAMRRRFQHQVGAAGELSLAELVEHADIQLSGVRVGEPDLGPDSRSIALTLHAQGATAHIICNGYWEELEFELPPLAEGRQWRRILDTGAETADQVLGFQEALPVREPTVRVGPRSIVCLATPAGLAPDQEGPT